MLKKLFYIVILLSILEAKELKKLVIAGPFASISHPIILMAKNKALEKLGYEIEFKLWKNPDELRAIALNSNINFLAVPTNVAANLYNKKVEIKLLNVSIWGILGMISRDKNLKTLRDFKGKEIVMPFRSDMPDLIFSHLVSKQGLDIKKDFDLKYVASPIDAMQMLVMRRVDHALLAEPAISIALRKTKSFPLKLVAPDLYRSANLQEEWGEVYKKEAKIPQAALAFLGETKGKEKLIKTFLDEYKKAIDLYKKEPLKSAKIVVETLPMLEEKGLSDSISYINLEAVSSQNSKKDLEEFFTILKESNAKLIGGKLPDESFYY